MVEGIRLESSGLLRDVPRFGKVLHEARGSTSAVPICLPWLDVEMAILVAVNRFPGDDLGIALDYRTDTADPRVVASDWDPGPGGCRWREVAPSFSKFVQLLGSSAASLGSFPGSERTPE